MGKTSCRGRGRCEKCSLFCKTIEPFSCRARTFARPQSVAQVLFNERNLRLDGQFDIGEGRAFPTIRGNARQNPATALLIHQAACAIDRIGDHAPDRILFPCAARQSDLSGSEAFCNQNNRLAAGNSFFKEFYQQGFADAVNCINCVARTIVGNFRHFCLGGLLAGRHDDVANFFVNCAYRLKEPTGIRHSFDINSGSG